MPHLIVRNIGANWLGHLVSAATAFITLPIVLHRLGQDAYGLWVTVVAIVAYTEFVSAGLGDTLVRGMAVRMARDDTAGCNTWFSLGVYANLAISALVIPVVGVMWLVVRTLVPLDPALHAMLPAVFGLVGAHAVLSFLTIPFGAVVWARQRFDLVNGTVILSRLAYLAAVILLLRGDRALVALGWISTGRAALSGLLSVGCAFLVLPGLRLVGWASARALRQEAMPLTVWLLVKLVATRVIYQTDLVVLAILRGPGAVAIYAIAGSLIDYARALLEKLKVVGPAAAALHGQGHTARFRALFTTSAKGSTMLGLAMAVYLLVFGGAFITSWVGDAYAGAAPILYILLVALVVKAHQTTSESVLFGAAEIRMPATVSVVEAAANLGLSLVLGYWLGGVGVALGTAIPAVLLWGGWFSRLAPRRVGLAPRQFVENAYLRPLGGAVLPLAAALAIRLLLEPRGLGLLFALVPVVALLAAVSFYLTSLDPAERAGVRSVAGATLGGFRGAA